MRMDWDQSKGPRLDGPGQWVEIENVVAGLCANVFLSKLQCFGNPAAGVSSYQGRPSLGSRIPGQLPIIDCPTEHRFYSGQIAILQGLGSDHVETGILKRKHILL